MSDRWQPLDGSCTIRTSRDRSGIGRSWSEAACHPNKPNTQSPYQKRRNLETKINGDLGCQFCDLEGQYCDLGGHYCNLGGQYYDLGGQYYDLGDQYRNLGGQYCNLGDQYCNLGGQYCNLGGQICNFRSLQNVAVFLLVHFFAQLTLFTF